MSTDDDQSPKSYEGERYRFVYSSIENDIEGKCGLVIANAGMARITNKVDVAVGYPSFRDDFVNE